MFIICVRRHYNKNAHAINGDKLNPCAVPFKKTKQSVSPFKYFDKGADTHSLGRPLFPKRRINKMCRSLPLTS